MVGERSTGSSVTGVRRPPQERQQAQGVPRSSDPEDPLSHFKKGAPQGGKAPKVFGIVPNDFSVPGQSFVNSAFNNGLGALGLMSRSVVGLAEQGANVATGQGFDAEQLVADQADTSYGFGTSLYRRGIQLENSSLGSGIGGALDKAIGFSGDVAADPLSWLTFGANAAIGKGARMAAGSKAANLGLGPDVVRRVTKYGAGALTADERKLLGLGEAGLYFGRNATKPIAGTEGIGAALGQFTSGARGFAMSRMPSKLADARAPRSLQHGTELFRTLRTGQGDVVTAAAVLGREMDRKITANTITNTFKQQVNEPLMRLDDRTAVQATHELETGGQDVFRAVLDELRTMAKNAGVKIGYIPNHVPHSWTEAGFRLLHGESQLSQDLRKVFRINKDDPSGASLERVIVKDKEYTIGGEKITFEHGTIDEINEVLAAKFPELGGAKFLEDDIRKLLPSYIDRIARDVGTVTSLKRVAQGNSGALHKFADWSVEELDAAATATANKKAAGRLKDLSRKRAASNAERVRDARETAEILQGDLKAGLDARLAEMTAEMGAIGQRLQTVAAQAKTIADARKGIEGVVKAARKRIDKIESQLIKQLVKLDEDILAEQVAFEASTTPGEVSRRLTELLQFQQQQQARLAEVRVAKQRIDGVETEMIEAWDSAQRLTAMRDDPDAVAEYARNFLPDEEIPAVIRSTQVDSVHDHRVAAAERRLKGLQDEAAKTSREAEVAAKRADIPDLKRRIKNKKQVLKRRQRRLDDALRARAEERVRNPQDRNAREPRDVNRWVEAARRWSQVHLRTDADTRAWEAHQVKLAEFDAKAAARQGDARSAQAGAKVFREGAEAEQYGNRWYHWNKRADELEAEYMDVLSDIAIVHRQKAQFEAADGNVVGSRGSGQPGAALDDQTVYQRLVALEVELEEAGPFVTKAQRDVLDGMREVNEARAALNQLERAIDDKIAEADRIARYGTATERAGAAKAGTIEELRRIARSQAEYSRETYEAEAARTVGASRPPTKAELEQEVSELLDTLDAVKPALVAREVRLSSKPTAAEVTRLKAVLDELTSRLQSTRDELASLRKQRGAATNRVDVDIPGRTWTDEELPQIRASMDPDGPQDLRAFNVYDDDGKLIYKPGSRVPSGANRDEWRRNRVDWIDEGRPDPFRSIPRKGNDGAIEPDFDDVDVSRSAFDEIEFDEGVVHGRRADGDDAYVVLPSGEGMPADKLYDKIDQALALGRITENEAIEARKWTRTTVSQWDRDAQAMAARTEQQINLKIHELAEEEIAARELLDLLTKKVLDNPDMSVAEVMDLFGRGKRGPGQVMLKTDPTNKNTHFTRPIAPSEMKAALVERYGTAVAAMKANKHVEWKPRRDKTWPGGVRTEPQWRDFGNNQLAQLYTGQPGNQGARKAMTEAQLMERLDPAIASILEVNPKARAKFVENFNAKAAREWQEQAAGRERLARAQERLAATRRAEEELTLGAGAAHYRASRLQGDLDHQQRLIDDIDSWYEEGRKVIPDRPEVDAYGSPTGGTIKGRGRLFDEPGDAAEKMRDPFAKERGDFEASQAAKQAARKEVLDQADVLDAVSDAVDAKAAEEFAALKPEFKAARLSEFNNNAQKGNLQVEIDATKAQLKTVESKMKPAKGNLEKIAQDSEAIIKAGANDPHLAAAAVVHSQFVDQVSRISRDTENIAGLNRMAALARSASTTKKVKGTKKGKPPGLVQVMRREMIDGMEKIGTELMDEADWLVARPEVARMFKNLDTVMQDGSFWKAWDTTAQFWKTYATATPGFHVRNAMSATFMNMSDGVTVADTLKATRLWREYMGQKDPRAWLKGQDEPTREAFQAVFGSGAGGHYSAAEIGEKTGLGGVLMDNKFVRTMGKAGRTVEGSVRLSVALNSKARGETLEQTTARIARLHFDYSDVSKMDVWAKRLIPFWTFMSRNLPLQIQQMAARPRAYARYTYFVNNMRDDDGEFPMPLWLREMNAFKIGSTAGGTGMVLNPDLPFVRMGEEIGKFNLADPSRIASDFNPFLRVPMELMTNRKLYFDQEIGGAGDKARYAATQMIPTWAQAQRLGSFGDYEGRSMAQAFTNYLGGPIRAVPEASQNAEIRRRERYANAG